MNLLPSGMVWGCFSGHLILDEAASASDPQPSRPVGETRGISSRMHRCVPNEMENGHGKICVVADKGKLKKFLAKVGNKKKWT